MVYSDIRAVYVPATVPAASPYEEPPPVPTEKEPKGRLIFPDAYNLRTEDSPEYARQRVDWAAFEAFGYLMQRHPWRYARTMPKWPHWYTLRDQWADRDEFRWAVRYLLRHGYRYWWGRKWYSQVNVNEHHYWNMGWDEQDTVLVNRAEHRRGHPYDVVAPAYDSRFDAPAFRAEDDEVFSYLALKLATAEHVLDVGAGTGLALNYLPERARPGYVGIDPSACMLAELGRRWPAVRTVPVPLRHFCPPPVEDGPAGVQRYDVVLGLYGVGSYLTAQELARVPSLLKPGGMAAMMFFAPGYTPDTHHEFGVTLPFRRWHEGLFPAQTVVPLSTGRHVLAIFHNHT